MSASESDVRWLSLLEEKTRDFIGYGYTHLANISDARSFRSKFESFCKKQGEHRAPRLEARFLPTYTPIIDLAQTVGRSATDLRNLAPKDTLEALIWRISFALIECGYNAGIQLSSLVGVVAELNRTVPRISSELGAQFPNSKNVQKPLQDIYRVFIDAHLSIVEHWSRPGRVQHPREDEALARYVAETSQKLEAARGIFDVMANQAAEDLQRRQADESLDALQRAFPEVLHVNHTSSREIHARFVAIRHLGRGSYGTVEEVRESSTGASYARKLFHLDPDKSSDLIEKEVKNEVAIMQKLRHLHIATVLFHLKEDEAYSIIMLPVADYDLRKFLTICTEQDYPPNLTKQIYPWFGCLLDALAYAHKLKIKHQDIKPSNILIKNNQPYLCDFGLAKDFERWDESTSHGDEVHGTLVYRAPEVVHNARRGRKADVFSLGCVYSEMFTISQERSLEAFRNMRQKAGTTIFRGCLPAVGSWLRSFDRNKLNKLLVDQILSMIERDVERRPSAEEAENFLKRERALFCVE